MFQFVETSELSGIKRIQTGELAGYLSIREIKILTGVRRSGKSTIMYQLVDTLLEKGVDPENILLVNFEDNRLRKREIGEIFDFYMREVNPEGTIYLFMDEIQNSHEWCFWVRKTYDTDRNVFMLITGSSSNLLPREYSTLLTGRVLQFNVFPVSFAEFLAFKNLTIKKPALAGTKTKTKRQELWGQAFESVF